MIQVAQYHPDPDKCCEACVFDRGPHAAWCPRHERPEWMREYSASLRGPFGLKALRLFAGKSPLAAPSPLPCPHDWRYHQPHPDGGKIYRCTYCQDHVIVDRCLCGGVGCNSCEPQGRG